MRYIQMRGEGMPFSGFRNPNSKSIAPSPPDDVPEWGYCTEYKNAASSCMLFTFYLSISSNSFSLNCNNIIITSIN